MDVPERLGQLPVLAKRRSESVESDRNRPEAASHLNPVPARLPPLGDNAIPRPRLVVHLVSKTSPYAVIPSEYCGRSPSLRATSSLALFVAWRIVEPASHSRRNGSSQL